jgi:hypothetical protein
MNQKILIGLGVVLVVVLLAGGAFMAMRLVNARGQNSTSGSEKTVKVDYISASELPKQAADLGGLVIRVKDNSVFVAQVNLDNTSVRRLLQQPTPAGPYTEVVVSKDTKIYRDATYDNVPTPSGGSSEGAGQRVQQKLDLVDTSAITTPSYAQVWGERRGSRINANIIVVSAPIVINGAKGR